MRGCHLALFCLIAVGTTAGCKKASPARTEVRITRVTVSDGRDDEAPDPARLAALTAAAQRGLLAAGVAVDLAAASSQPGDFQLRMQLQVQLVDAKPPPPGTATAEPALPPERAAHRLQVVCAGMATARRTPTLSETPPGPDSSEPPAPELTKLEHVALTEKTVQGEPPPAEVLALVDRLVEDGAKTLGGELQLIGSDSRNLVAIISDGQRDPELRRTAIQILGQRKERLALTPLIALVKERVGDEPQGEKREQRAIRRALRDSAIGALVAIGDRSAVKPLLNSVAFADATEMGKLVEAVAALGGEEARQYLLFVKSSHPEPEIRSEAEAALKRLDQHQHEAQTPPPR